MLPIYGQMPVAALLAIWGRANLIISVALVWISNPVTYPLMLIAEYWLGCWILGVEPQLQIDEFQFDNLISLISEIGLALGIGGLVAAIIGAILGYVLAHLFWWMAVTQRWRDRKSGRSSSELNADTGSSSQNSKVE